MYWLQDWCVINAGKHHFMCPLKGQSHEKVGELRVWGGSIGPN
jgi:hypothetical protein